MDPVVKSMLDVDRVRSETVTAIVDYLRYTASGYALMRSIKMNGASEALYGIAEKLEKNWQSVVLPRVSPMKAGDP